MRKVQATIAQIDGVSGRIDQQRRESLDSARKSLAAGDKPAAAYADAQSATPGSWSRALVCLFLAVALVFGAIIAAGGRPF